MIAKIKMNSEQTRSTFVIEGIEARRAFTIKRIPSFLEITRRGLSALKALRALRA
jgi:hypothetical protein